MVRGGGGGFGLRLSSLKEDDASVVHRYPRTGLGRGLVSYAFTGFNAAREANNFLRSPELTFQVMEDPRLNYSFMLRLYPNNGLIGDADRGKVSLYWEPRAGTRGT